MTTTAKVPMRAWVVTLAGTAVNLCLGILYAWSVWKSTLIGTAEHPAGTPMTGINEGWLYLTDAQGTWAYSICGFLFALGMIPGGRLQDRYGPRWGATLGGVLLATGCVIAGLSKSYLGLIVGFGVLGGIGMGLAYAAATPAAVKWFGPHRRGLIVGIVVGGFGGAAIYISPLAKWLIAEYGLTGSFVGLGGLFAVVIIAAAQLLRVPPAGYVPPPKALLANATASGPNATVPAPANQQSKRDFTPSQMIRTWQFYALVFLFIGTAQSGLLVIANATPMLNSTAKNIAFFAANAWLLASFGGIVNASGRVGTGLYSDRIGRSRAYLLNCSISAICLFLTPTVMASGNVVLLFLMVGVAYWQYGGGLSLMPAFTADYFGAKYLGSNYGLVFLGWGIAFFIPQLAGVLKDWTGKLDIAFYISGGLLLASVAVCTLLRPPAAEGAESASNQ
ncbi:L-lactate MFS transporter [Tuwongella immobilis]|uniref:Major facilitator superfamily (MFS) profile domain-containing protein n=1 Tax=Tuwongella immobilis TaxID=692036 RepID=A0A6C2YIS0_9BACT|nr:OFA family MFS transporter [Tuwongella immobilis]VIP01264.1 transporter : Nitrate/nitrite transporter OS=Desulfomonile tiedjei (strain ATCC 49306 / DSM 6799 / DCB-1) GN=Desti_1770 PE=4 SV=1: MFS_1 [Tuwongella immobilis]VTR97954.1 transporter : Nitrate/nitrite transporter OS=Desulfomonile tiedjei (strain ATCC 49306 / DSM 6799 / DCB-1) GN=Desti_1770 PE=4 SV=1: MFS_1 [Tuwongella immobilis]